ncbi:hypothetical protein M427DRAFT_177152 [Gonapodya prolifera JEL478]|uniref:Uncharacterized protein n=1 Tax=Gonapodya prolifera (strain JEL478) TaxID=1344416 RepID=A0A139APZ3_GONPJ|nr:hypothetical protein M427DRAFT_177152 [Gonapodya prolifera JEL478]|eukprot:KXS18831.1 hypothetical protein M427DRAFT_177152 [Gonapodya prolifera JEL478]
MDLKSPERDPEDQDLFEAAHAICTGIYEHNQRYKTLIVDFAPFYTNALLESFPDPVDFDLLRRCFTSVVRGLSSASTFHYSASTFVAGNEKVDQSREERNDSLGLGGPQKVEDVGKASDGQTVDVDSFAVEGLDERDLTAWTCILLLARGIISRQIAVESAENKLKSSEEAEQDRVKDAAFLVDVINAAREGNTRSGTDNKESSWTKLLMMEPGNVSRQRVERGQLAILLFDQIRAVSLRTLDPLLFLIEGLMLDGRIPPELEDGIISTDNGSVGAGSNSTQNDDGLGYGLGLEVRPIEGNPLWKSLFDAISTERNFDFTKKRRCIEFYLGLVREAKEVFTKLDIQSNITRQSQDSILPPQNAEDVHVLK